MVTKDINTGWADKTAGFASDILTLWGMEDVGSATTTAPFTLTMSYMPNGGNTYLVRQNVDGTWTTLGGTLNADGTISASVSQDGTFAVVSEHAWHGGADL